ncbi:MAG: NAD(P)-binding domain-containing protein [Anaerolineales bacterium]
MISSRSEERAVTAASEIMELAEGSTSIVGTSNKEAAQLADIVVVSVPYAAHRETLESVKDVLKGKILIDVTAHSRPAKSDQSANAIRWFGGTRSKADRRRRRGSGRRVPKYFTRTFAER